MQFHAFSWFRPQQKNKGKSKISEISVTVYYIHLCEMSLVTFVSADTYDAFVAL